MLCGSAFKNKGVQPLLDAVVDYLPSPTTSRRGGERFELQANHRAPGDPDEPFTALAFKIVTTRTGRSPTCASTPARSAPGDSSTRPRPQGAHRAHPADAREPARGQDGARATSPVVGLKHTTTGDTLWTTIPSCSSSWSSRSRSSLAIEPKTKADQDKLGRRSGLSARTLVPDPQDAETGQTIIAGMGELHLEVSSTGCARVQGRGDVGRPQVAYRETISPQKAEERYMRQTGGRGQYGHVVLARADRPRRRVRVRQQVTGGVIPREFVPAVDAGIRGAGVRRARRLPDRRHRPCAHRLVPRGRLVEMAFKIAGSMALTRRPPRRRHPARAGHGGRGAHARRVHGRRHRRPSARRGPRAGHGARGNAPLPEGAAGEMFGYSADLRSLTQGRGDVHDAVRRLPAGADKSVTEIVARFAATS